MKTSAVWKSRLLRQPARLTNALILTNTAGNGGAFYQDGTGAITVTNSCIVNNSDTSVFHSAGPVIDATGNWWGTANGPSGVGSGNGDTVTNTGLNTATNLVITDAIPTGASYITGGTKVGNVVSWTIDGLAADSMTQITFVVTAAQTITNSDYCVSADGGYSAIGSVSVMTVIGSDSSFAYLPIILKNQEW